MSGVECAHQWATLIACDMVQVGQATHLVWCAKCGIDREPMAGVEAKQ